MNVVKLVLKWIAAALLVLMAAIGVVVGLLLCCTLIGIPLGLLMIYGSLVLVCAGLVLVAPAAAQAVVDFRSKLTSRVVKTSKA